MKNTFLIILLAFLASSCYNDKRENLNPQLPANDNTSACDTTTVTYTKDIQPILNSSCTGCHGTGSVNHSLNTFSDAKSHNDNIITRISNGSMPQGSSQLSDCKINKFKAWKNQGYIQ
jgi:hypothetical protein